MATADITAVLTEQGQLPFAKGYRVVSTRSRRMGAQARAFQGMMMLMGWVLVIMMIAGAELLQGSAPPDHFLLLYDLLVGGE